MSGKPLTVEQILKQMQESNLRAVTDPVDKFLEDVSKNALYWARIGKDKEDVASGVTFSILNLFDGTSLGSPPIDMTYVPDTDELPEGVEATPGFNGDVMLHELFYPVYRETAERMGYEVRDKDVIVPDAPRVFDGRLPENRTMFEPIVEGSLQDAQAEKVDELDAAVTLTLVNEYKSGIDKVLAALRPMHNVDAETLQRVAEQVVESKTSLKDAMTHLVMRLNAPRFPVDLPNDIHEAVNWLRDELGPDFRLSDEHANIVAESYMANKGKLEDAVKFFAKELSVETDHLMSISKEASNRAIPNFKAVVPKEERVAEFLESAANIAEYWAGEAKTPQEAAEGAVGSMMKLLDGGGDIPAMNLVPAVMDELVEEYNSEGIAGWPAEPINDETGLHDNYIAIMTNRRKKTALALA